MEIRSPSCISVLSLLLLNTIVASLKALIQVSHLLLLHVPQSQDPKEGTAGCCPAMPVVEGLLHYHRGELYPHQLLLLFIAESAVFLFPTLWPHPSLGTNPYQSKLSLGQELGWGSGT